MDMVERRVNLPYKQRRRPYSCNSSIKSIIHGPDINEIEEELKNLQLEDRISLLNRTHAGEINKTPSQISTPKEQIVDSRSTLPTSLRKRLPRPKTCIATFPNRKESVTDKFTTSAHHSVLSNNSSYFSSFDGAKRRGFPKSRSAFVPIKERSEKENLADRHEWAVRVNQEKKTDEEKRMAKRQRRMRHSSSAPPAGRSLKPSFYQGLAQAKRCQSAREVEAFTPASRMKNTIVMRPKSLNVFRPRPSPPTIFRMMYERGDIPCTLHHDYKGQSLRWKVDIDKMDYHQYLPLFFDGLRETRHPYDFFSRAGVRDMLSKGAEKIVPVIPQLILPIKKALDTRIPGVISTVLKVMQELVESSPGAGEALVPYYRQLLPTLNLFQHKNVNCGDEIDYSQQRRENLGDLIQETLELLERTGGKDAYVNIKYMVPTYHSCVNN